MPRACRCHVLLGAGVSEWSGEWCCTCCIHPSVQVDEGLKSLQYAMNAGFDNYEQIRKDKNLENLRKTPKFEAVLEQYDEPVINWGAVKATFGFFNKKKEE